MKNINITKVDMSQHKVLNTRKSFELIDFFTLDRKEVSVNEVSELLADGYDFLYEEDEFIYNKIA